MHVSEAIETRIEVREYTDAAVPNEVITAIIDAGRLAPSGRNLQHWRFVLVREPDDLAELARISTSGGWIADAAFAVVLATDPSYPYHTIDAGRAVTYMQFAAWSAGVGSCIYTGVEEVGIRELLAIPDAVDVTLVAGFGYPRFDIDSLRGRKDRKPLGEIAFDGRFGDPIDAD